MTESEAKKLIEVENLSRRYGDTLAVDDISFCLRQGDVLGFLGPNGAGKSTTMQMLCGALAPTQGGITINGIDLLEQPLAAKRAIGFLPEKPPLYNELTVDEYLRYCARLHGISKKDRPDAVAAAKQRCGLTENGSRLISNLSKGFQQRVGIAQAIIHTPQVVILDEPTVGLDPIQIREIRDLIRELGRDHGVILSTHILPEVQMTCNRVQIIHNGRLVFSDAIEDLNRNTEAASLLIGLAHPPATGIIENIHGIKRVETIADGRYRVHFKDGRSPAEEIARLAVNNNWGLLELTPESRNLEQVFIELTSAETTPAGEHAA